MPLPSEGIKLLTGPAHSELKPPSAHERQQTPQKARLEPIVSISQTYTPKEDLQLAAELRSNEVISKSSIKSNKAAFR